MHARDAARRWAETWRTAWEALDPEPIVGLYAAGATFSTEPFRAPYRGPAGVRAYVERVFGEEESPRVSTSEPIVDGDRAAVSWWAVLGENGADVTLAGTSVLRFDADGLVLEQWEPGTRPMAAAIRPMPARPSRIPTPELSRTGAVIDR